MTSTAALPQCSWAAHVPAEEGQQAGGTCACGFFGFMQIDQTEAAMVESAKVLIPRWDQDRIVRENGWVEGRCGKCGELLPTESDGGSG